MSSAPAGSLVVTDTATALNDEFFDSSGLQETLCALRAYTFTA